MTEKTALVTGGSRGIGAATARLAVESDVVRMFAEAESQLGPIVALVNNAGIVTPQARVDEMSAERIERALAVNVLGAILDVAGGR